LSGVPLHGAEDAAVRRITLPVNALFDVVLRTGLTGMYNAEWVLPASP